MPVRPSTLLTRTRRTGACRLSGYLSGLLLTAACVADLPDPPPPVTREQTRPAAAASACEVRLTAGVDAAAVELEDGKTYCVGDLEFTRKTSLAAAHTSLGGGCREQANEGATVLTCKGVELIFGGPVLVLSRIKTTNS